jgi:SAM-dependent methyltransferase
MAGFEAGQSGADAHGLMRQDNFSVFNYETVVFGRRSYFARSAPNLGGVRLHRYLQVVETNEGMSGWYILEVGCGAGVFSRSIARCLPLDHVFGTDVSRRAVAIANRLDGKVYYSVGDGQQLPMSEDSFDSIVFFDLLEHLPNPDAALSEFHRVLKPNGLLHGYVPCEGNPFTLYWIVAKVGLEYRLTERHAGHIHHFAAEDVTQSLEQAGFIMEKCSYSGQLMGQLLDLATFLARELIHRRRGFVVRSGNELLPRSGFFYDRSALDTGALSKIYGVVRRFLDAIVYVEACLLAWLPWAMGLHFTARKLVEDLGSEGSANDPSDV